MGFKGRTQGAFCLVFCFEICKVENLQERKEPEGRAEDQNPRISEGRRKGRRREERDALTQLGFAFLQYLFFKIFWCGTFFSLY